MSDLTAEEFTALVQLALTGSIKAADAVLIGAMLQKAVALANMKGRVGIVPDVGSSVAA